MPGGLVMLSSVPDIACSTTSRRCVPWHAVQHVCIADPPPHALRMTVASTEQ